MARVSKAYPHLSEGEIWEGIKGAKDHKRARKWLVIFNATVIHLSPGPFLLDRLHENIRLIPQPAHSPELNPAEHIWEELREKKFPNKGFSSLKAVEQALCTGIMDLANNPERLQSLTYFPHLNVHC